MATHDKFDLINPNLKCPICSQPTIACRNMECKDCIYDDECTDIQDCEHTELAIIKHLLCILEDYREERDIALENLRKYQEQDVINHRMDGKRIKL